jgi:hypothetical protein
MDLFATLFSIQGVFDTPEAEPTPGHTIPFEGARLDGGSSNGGCIVA